jgi:hypothetical protein
MIQKDVNHLGLDTTAHRKKTEQRLAIGHVSSGQAKE